MIGQSERAIELATLVRNHQVTYHEVRVWAVDLLADRKAELGEEAYNAAWERGRQLDLETVVQELLESYAQDEN